MTDAFHINWQDPVSRRWHPVAKLWRRTECFVFAYTNGALLSSRFSPFAGLTDINSIYVSTTLFPLFANRVMNERRPEFRQYARWSGMTHDLGTDPLLLTARMGGDRATDTLQINPVPERGRDGRYKAVFFCHGTRHVSFTGQARVATLRPGERLFPMFDFQNPFDADAIALRSDDPPEMIGYCPRYLATDFKKIAAAVGNRFQFAVKQFNHDAPPQYQLLCEASGPWPLHFSPFDDNDHQTVRQFDVDRLIEDIRAGTIQRNRGAT